MKASLEYPTVMGRPLTLPASTCNKQCHSGTGAQGDGGGHVAGAEQSSLSGRQTRSQTAADSADSEQRLRSCLWEGVRSEVKQGDGEGKGVVASHALGGINFVWVGGLWGSGNYERRLQQLQFYATFWLNFCANSCLNIRQTRKG